MTREDEIRSASSDHRDWVCCGFIDFIADARRDSFVEGAKWADKTMIDKACEWLDQNVVKYESGTKMGYIPFSLIEDMINDFRKAMKE
jgi:hypothetical protein